MLSQQEGNNVTELLSALNLEDILSLASTVTNGMLKPTNKAEAVEAIIRYSTSIESLLNRQKVTKELIFNYLHWKKVPLEANRDKKYLSNLLTKYWKEQLKNEQNSTGPDNKCAVKSSGPLTVDGLEPAEVDLLAMKFTEWFYHMLNKDFLEGGNFAVGPEHFWNDATLHMQLMSNNDKLDEEVEGSQTVVQTLNETKHRYKLYFSPNLCAEGVKGRSEPHGLVAVLVCGTLHQSAGVVIGLFEQIFYLMKDPLSNNNWKVKRTLLNLTSKSDITAPPTLHQGSLTATLLPIENPD